MPMPCIKKKQMRQGGGMQSVSGFMELNSGVTGFSFRASARAWLWVAPPSLSCLLAEDAGLWQGKRLKHPVPQVSN